jgi:[ribosomal protein S5]-alanine N-acetyltransferase
MNFEIKTERLFLRQPCMADADRLFHLMSDTRLTHFLTWEPHKNIETTKDVVQNLVDSQDNDRGYHWCVFLNDEIIGLVSLIDVKRKIRTWTLNRAELSYWIGTRYQGKGYATEASRSIIDYGFKSLNLHKIIVAHASDNIESQSICKKLNFTKYAYEHDAFQKNNRFYDLIWHELINAKSEKK